MTREQYEKLKEWIKTAVAYSIVQHKSARDDMLECEKELNKLMGFEE